MPNDRYGTVGTGLGAGTGAGTVQVRYGDGTSTIHGYGPYGTWVRKPYPRTVHMYRTDHTHVSYPYRARTVPVPYPHPHPNPYQASRTCLKPLARPPSHLTS